MFWINVLRQPRSFFILSANEAFVLFASVILERIYGSTSDTFCKFLHPFFFNRVFAFDAFVITAFTKEVSYEFEYILSIPLFVLVITG